MKTSDNVTKSTSLQSLIMTSFYETLQRRHYCDVVSYFYRNYLVSSKRRQIVTLQQHCNDVIVSTGTQCPFTGHLKHKILNNLQNALSKFSPAESTLVRFCLTVMITF